MSQYLFKRSFPKTIINRKRKTLIIATFIEKTRCNRNINTTTKQRKHRLEALAINCYRLLISVLCHSCRKWSKC